MKSIKASTAASVCALYRLARSPPTDRWPLSPETLRWPLPEAGVAFWVAGGEGDVHAIGSRDRPAFVEAGTVDGMVETVGLHHVFASMASKPPKASTTQ